MSNIKNHAYGQFIEGIQLAGHAIEWNDTNAIIVLKSGFTVYASFSYNESKIYFKVGGRSFRVLDHGALSVQAIEALDAALESATKEAFYPFEG